MKNKLTPRQKRLARLAELGEVLEGTVLEIVEIDSPKGESLLAQAQMDESRIKRDDPLNRLREKYGIGKER